MRQNRRLAYWRERTRQAGWSLSASRDLKVAVITFLVSLWLTGLRNFWSNVWIPFVSAFVAILIYETCRFAWRFVVTVPMDSHFEHLSNIEALEKRFDARVENLERELRSQRGSAKRCRELAELIAALDGASTQAAENGWAKPLRHGIKMATGRAEKWLAENVGPVQSESFKATKPVAFTYSKVPKEWMADWQVARGRVEYLKTLAEKLCG